MWNYHYDWLSCRRRPQVCKVEKNGHWLKLESLGVSRPHLTNRSQSIPIVRTQTLDDICKKRHGLHFEDFLSYESPFAFSDVPPTFCSLTPNYDVQLYRIIYTHPRSFNVAVWWSTINVHNQRSRNIYLFISLFMNSFVHSITCSFNNLFTCSLV